MASPRTTETDDPAFSFAVSRLPPPAPPPASPPAAEGQQDAEAPNADAELSNAPDDHTGDDAKKRSKVVDPLRWFGVLVPPALRSAQGSFIQAVEGPVPRLLNIVRDMRSLESDISRLRKEIKRRAAEQWFITMSNSRDHD